MTENTIAALREILFDHIRAAKDTSVPLDMQRHKVVAESSRLLVDLAKAEIDYADVMNGAVDVPFFEHQDRPNKERGNLTGHLSSIESPVQANTQETPPTKSVFEAGPASDHPWRKR